MTDKKGKRSKKNTRYLKQKGSAKLCMIKGDEKEQNWEVVRKRFSIASQGYL